MNYKNHILFLLFAVVSTGLFAQPYVSNKGLYEVDQIKGCAPLTVNITIRPPAVCNGLNPCDMDFEGNTMFQNLTYSHTYKQPGTYTLNVLFQTLGTDQITITVLPNTPPTFDIYSCGGNSAQVKVTDTNYNQYVINYNDGSPDVIVPSGSLAKDSHTFLTGGNKIVTVRGRNLGADDNCDPTNKPIVALAVLPVPTITMLEVLDDKSLRLDFNNQQNILYKLEIAVNSTTFQPYQDIYNVNTYTALNLKPDDAYYCFRLGAFDPCNNVTVYSNTICSADFDAAAQNNQNRLNWATGLAGISSYSITKTNAASFSVNALQTSLDDTDVICGNKYCYKMTSLYTNGSRAISLEKCVTAFSSDIPATIQNISTRVTGNNSVDLVWIQDPGFNVADYTVLKGGTPIGTSNVTTFTDNTLLPGANLCYTINYTDACGNKSLTSAEACPINLTGSLQPTNSVNLSWTAYNGWRNGVDHYMVERFSDQGDLLQSFNVGTSTILVDDEEDPDHQTYVYRVTAFAVEAGVIESISNTITVIKEPNIYHPSAFTPNGDGLNDTFQVFGQYTESVEFKIFNRWGEMLFITTDLGVSWDGSYKGNAVPEGTYVFRAFLTDMVGRTVERSGNVLLMRKRP
ncbi:MAG: T9SS type B sorting domain-containing protein [Chryseolinea sp.]